jgi:hypothetical protein
MSYDLAFWKQKPTCTASPSSIYGDLLEGRAVDGLETIPTTEFITRVQERFLGISTDGGLTFWEGGKRGMFELCSSDQHVHFCCRQMSGDDMNILVDIAVAFDCRLYDPQTGKRYDGSAA